MSTDNENLLDGIISDLEAATQKSQSDEDRLPVCFMPEGDYEIRLGVDSKGKLFQEARYYKVPDVLVGHKEGSGEEIRRNVWYRASMKWDDDPIGPYAEELGYPNTAKYGVAVFGVVREIFKGASEYFAPGPCIHIVNKKFLTAITAAIKNMITDKDPGRAQFGRSVVSSSLDFKKPGFVIKITATRGQQGTVNAEFKTFGYNTPPDIVAPEIYAKFEDISKVYFPQVGPENDKNGLIIIEHYKQLIKEKQKITDPAPGWTPEAPKSPVTQAAPAQEVKTSSTTPEPTGTAKVISDLDRALDGGTKSPEVTPVTPATPPTSNADLEKAFLDAKIK